MSTETDDQVEQWARKVLAGAPRPTPAQLDLVRRIFRATDRSDVNPTTDAA